MSKQTSASYGELVSAELWDRLVARIVSDQYVGLDRAEDILDATLGFLKLRADYPDFDPASPSPLVDIGWHVFLLYTREYEQFCEKYAGGMIHHEPNDKPGARPSRWEDTARFMRKNGVAFNPKMWGGNDEPDETKPKRWRPPPEAACFGGHGHGCN